MGDDKFYGVFMAFECNRAKVAHQYSALDSAQTMWENLQKRYSVANTPRIRQLKANIASCKQVNLNVVEFFSKLAGLWSELEIT